VTSLLSSLMAQDRMLMETNESMPRLLSVELTRSQSGEIWRREPGLVV
jgi:hypothetical protein